jgi:D-serine dehydratase
MQRELLNEYEQFDASKSKPSSTKILEEEYEDESDHQPLGAEEGTSDSTPNEGETDTWTFNTRQSTELFWGYSVALQRYQENLNRDPKLLIQRPKLMMLGTGYTVGDRIGLRRKLTELIK